MNYVVRVCRTSLYDHCIYCYCYVTHRNTWIYEMSDMMTDSFCVQIILADSDSNLRHSCPAACTGAQVVKR